jgi:hypothetical protein
VRTATISIHNKSAFTSHAFSAIYSHTWMSEGGDTSHIALLNTVMIRSTVAHSSESKMPDTCMQQHSGHHLRNLTAQGQWQQLGTQLSGRDLSLDSEANAEKVHAWNLQPERPTPATPFGQSHKPHLYSALCVTVTLLSLATVALLSHCCQHRSRCCRTRGHASMAMHDKTYLRIHTDGDVDCRRLRWWVHAPAGTGS